MISSIPRVSVSRRSQIPMGPHTGRQNYFYMDQGLPRISPKTSRFCVSWAALGAHTFDTLCGP